MCEMDNSYQVPTPFDDKYLDGVKMLTHGKLYCGTDLRWNKKRIYQLEHVDRNDEQQKELEALRVEIGLTRSGEKKPGVCWDYVSFGRCQHTSSQTFGDVLGGRWHPDSKERLHLQNIQKTGKRRTATEHQKYRKEQEKSLEDQILFDSFVAKGLWTDFKDKNAFEKYKAANRLKLP